MEQILNILLGAVIASIVPIVTLVLNQKKWKTEKKIEFLRTKHDRLETIYTDVLSQLNDAINQGLWPSQITSKISVYGSEDVRNTYFEFIKNKDKGDNQVGPVFYLQMCIACNDHLRQIQDEIEGLL